MRATLFAGCAAEAPPLTIHAQRSPNSTRQRTAPNGWVERRDRRGMSWALYPSRVRSNELDRASARPLRKIYAKPGPKLRPGIRRPRIERPGNSLDKEEAETDYGNNSCARQERTRNRSRKKQRSKREGRKHIEKGQLMPSVTTTRRKPKEHAAKMGDQERGSVECLSSSHCEVYRLS